MAFSLDRISVRQRVCCMTLLRGRFTRFTLLSVWVNHCSGRPDPSTTLTEDALGAKAAAEAGSSCGGIVSRCVVGDGRRRGSEVSKTGRLKASRAEPNR